MSILQARHNGQGVNHAATLNALAAQGLITPVKTKLKDGRVIVANSTITMIDWLNDQGLNTAQYKIEDV